MKKAVNLLVLFTSMLGYLEWGKDQHRFIFSIYLEIIQKFISNPISVLHPLIILPFIGQMLLLISIFYKTPNKLMSLIGLALLSSIILVLLIVGILTVNVKIMGSCLPFIFAGIWMIKIYTKKVVES